VECRIAKYELANLTNYTVNNRKTSIYLEKPIPVDTIEDSKDKFCAKGSRAKADSGASDNRREVKHAGLKEGKAARTV
jgi:hypothetical protein